MRKPFRNTTTGSMSYVLCCQLVKALDSYSSGSYVDGVLYDNREW